MLRACAVGLLLLSVGCTSGPQKLAEPPPRVSVVRAPATPPKPAPPTAKPLPVVKVSVTPYARWAEVRVGPLGARPFDDKLVAAALPPVSRARFEAALAAAGKLEKAAAPVYEAHFRALSCDPGKCEALEAKHAQLRTALDRQADGIQRAHDKTVDAFDAQLEKAPSAALALAVARLHQESTRHSDIVTMNRPAASSEVYGELSADPDGGSPLAEAALERARDLSQPDTDLGRLARYALALSRWRSASAPEALAEIDALLPVAPAEQKFELLVRQALLLGVRGRHAEAAGGFARALAEPEMAKEAVLRAQLRSAQALAEYRAGRLREALALALAELGRSSLPAHAFAASPASGAALTVAADVVERLAIDVEGASVGADGKAAILSELAVRALHRHDQQGARRLAERAVQLGPRASAGAFDVLIALAKKQSDGARVAELGEQKRVARPSMPFESGLLALLGGKPRAPEFDERAALKDDAKADAKRNVASLVRLCLEPNVWRLTHRDGASELTLSALVKDDGSVTVDVTGDAPSEVTECVTRMGPKVLARAPSSVHAQIDLSHVRESELFAAAGLWGKPLENSIGRADGVGGLGLRGAGSGTRVGGTIGIGAIGGLGTRGQGGGAGVGSGRGSGRGFTGRKYGGPKPALPKPAVPKQAPTP
ncbi:MAG: hypothetical protein HYZ29_29985 [Myxococcales bacterium]|nr:hypothetical protein [Myxococcales bacterium]